MMINLLLEPLGYEFIQRALLTAVMVGIICGVVGSFLIVKRWSLLGDAISHAVLPGVALAFLWGWPYFVGAVITALMTAVGISFVEQNSRVKADAAMGIMFISAFAAGLAILSRVRGQIDIFHILFGNVLGVANIDIWLTAATGLLVVTVVALLYKELVLWAFDPVTAQVMGLPVRGLHYLMMLLLSVTIVASLQAVGIVLVVAMLITPAATAFLLVKRFGPMMLLACGLGVFAAVTGLFLSYYVNLASGATMVLVSTSIFLITLLFSPQEGLVWRRWRRWRRARRIVLEDCLKTLHALQTDETAVPLHRLAAALGEDTGRVMARIRLLADRGQVRQVEAGSPNGPASSATGTAGASGSGADTAAVLLTADGIRQARAVIRTHRLWERYLTDEGGMPWHVVHAEAHALEHETSPQAADRLDEALGYPQHDPHGAPIPSREGELPGVEEIPLTDLEDDHPAVVQRVEDEDPAILQRLDAFGLRPGAEIVKVGMREQGVVVVRVGDHLHDLNAALAAEVFVKPA
ncbi:MAG: metal ABC transporter permease [Thermaerobacterales bacterium]